MEGKKKAGSPAALLAMLLTISLTLLLMAAYRTGRIYFLTGKFVVLSSHVECQTQKWRSQLCATHYSIRIPDGTIIDFIPFRDEFNDGALHDGTTFAKPDKGLYYTVNGTYEQWPFLPKAVGLFLSGCLGLVAFVARSGPRHLGWGGRVVKPTPSNHAENVWILLGSPLRRRKKQDARGKHHSS